VARVVVACYLAKAGSFCSASSADQRLHDSRSDTRLTRLRQCFDVREEEPSGDLISRLNAHLGGFGGPVDQVRLRLEAVVRAALAEMPLRPEPTIYRFISMVEGTEVVTRNCRTEKTGIPGEIQTSCEREVRPAIREQPAVEVARAGSLVSPLKVPESRRVALTISSMDELPSSHMADPGFREAVQLAQAGRWREAAERFEGMAGAPPGAHEEPSTYCLYAHNAAVAFYLAGDSTRARDLLRSWKATLHNQILDARAAGDARTHELLLELSSLERGALSSLVEGEAAEGQDPCRRRP
jgi:hypothetical protein